MPCRRASGADCSGGWAAVSSPITIVSSAEAVGAILEQVERVEGAAEWLRRGLAIATHPRVAQRLHAAGFANVEAAASDDSAVIGKLESIQG